MKPMPSMTKGEPEIASGSTKLIGSAESILERERLAKKVQKLAIEAFRGYEHSLKKLTELRPFITKLRELFMRLKHGEKIAGCRTWTEFCARVLHRTDRRLRQILKGANPASEKHSRKTLRANNGMSALPEPKTTEVPEPHNAEWTPELVVETSFDFVYSVFQKAKLPHEDHKQAVLQLIDKLRHDVLLGD
jgi:hypothetical protein